MPWLHFMSCSSVMLIFVSLVLPLTRTPLRFGVNEILCFLLGDIFICLTVHFASGHFEELNNRGVTNIFPTSNYNANAGCDPLSWVYCFFSYLDISGRYSLWTRRKYSEKSTACKHMYINFLQLVTVSLTSLNIGHTSWISIYKLLLCQFRGSQCNMNICKCSRLIMCLTRTVSFNGHLLLNYTMFDVWLTALIFEV